MVSVLSRIFGMHNLELAEDVVQEAFVKAMQEWAFRGIPDNPSGWLMRVARNQAIDVIRRQKHTTEFSPDISPLLKSEYTISTIEQFFLDSEIEDSQLRMIFACCHPELEPEVQIAFTLKNISGLSTPEIAKALLSSEDAIQKRLYRAKNLIREKNIQLDIPVRNQLSARLETVLAIIYLIFNEGYNSSQEDMLIRKDLCVEAVRLAYLLSNHSLGRSADTYALLALMCFHSSRFASRVDEEGKIILLSEQNREGWDMELIQMGFNFMGMGATGDKIGSYHIEAAIAAEHCRAKNIESTNWEYLLSMYDLLLQSKDTPVVRLNRAVVINKLKGAQTAIDEILQIKTLEKLLKTNYIFSAVLGELYMQLHLNDKAREYLSIAQQLTSSNLEKSLMQSKINSLGENAKSGEYN